MSDNQDRVGPPPQAERSAPVLVRRSDDDRRAYSEGVVAGLRTAASICDGHNAQAAAKDCRAQMSAAQAYQGAERSARGVTPTFEEVRSSYLTACADHIRANMKQHYVTVADEEAGRDAGLRAVMSLYSSSPNTSSAPTAFVEAAKALSDSAEVACEFLGDIQLNFDDSVVRANLRRDVDTFDLALASVDAQAPAPSPVGVTDEWVIDLVQGELQEWFAKRDARIAVLESKAVGEERVLNVAAEIARKMWQEEIDALNEAVSAFDARLLALEGKCSKPGCGAPRVEKLLHCVKHTRAFAAFLNDPANHAGERDAKCAGCGHAVHVGKCVHITGYVDAGDDNESVNYCGCVTLTPAAVEGREAEPLDDLHESAWGIIANVIDWSAQREGWQGAAARWRDDYHARLKMKAAPTPPPAETAMAPEYDRGWRECHAAAMDAVSKPTNEGAAFRVREALMKRIQALADPTTQGVPTRKETQ